MAKFLSTMLIGVCVCCLLSGTLSQHATADPSSDSAKTEPPSESTRMAVVDMARVFKMSKSFEQRREALKVEILDSTEVAKKMTAEIQQLSQKSMGLEKGSDERKELEVRLKRKQAELLEYQKEESRKFLKAESAIYLQTYRIAVTEITSYAQARGIDLVIRHNSEPVEEEDPQKLLQSMNRLVIYENKLDITDEIIAAIAEQ